MKIGKLNCLKAPKITEDYTLYQTENKFVMDTGKVRRLEMFMCKTLVIETTIQL